MQLVMTVSHEVNLAGFTVTKVKKIFSVSVPITLVNTQNVSGTKIVDSSSIQGAESKL